jgi:hypothetical protein
MPPLASPTPTHCVLPTDMPLLDSLHWDEGSSMYLDWGLHTEGVEIRRTTQMVDGRPQVGVGRCQACFG